jgi:hypothetical protein
MRPLERIDNFLERVNWGWLLKDHWKVTPNFDFIKLDHIVNITNYWRENPDQRIGQVLINLELIPDNFRIWTDEESDILIDQGIPPEECLYWTSLYDKNENLLDTPITKLIKDLEPGYIKKILKRFYRRLSENYKKAFDNVLQAYCLGITYDIE